MPIGPMSLRPAPGLDRTTTTQASKETMDMTTPTKITPCLWFDPDGEEAATLYTTIDAP